MFMHFYLSKRKDGPDKLWSQLRLPDDGHINKSHASVNKSVVGISRVEPCRFYGIDSRGPSKSGRCSGLPYQ
jgi:hypothetical protein